MKAFFLLYKGNSVVFLDQTLKKSIKQSFTLPEFNTCFMIQTSTRSLLSALGD